MNRWIDGFGFLLGTALIGTFSGVGYCQDLEPKFQLQGSAGFINYDKALEFEPSPYFGFGAGLDISNVLQLNLSLSYSPTRQRILQAASDWYARYHTFHYCFVLKLRKHQFLREWLHPFINIGVGAMVINPQSVHLELGAGRSLKVEPPVEHLWNMRFGGGISVGIFRHLQIYLEVRRYVLHLKSIGWIANNALLLGFSTRF